VGPADESERHPQTQPEREIEFPLFFRDPAWSTETTVTCANASIVDEKRRQCQDSEQKPIQNHVREVRFQQCDFAYQKTAAPQNTSRGASRKAEATRLVRGFHG
jgi:hypothetical protein